MTEIQNNVNTTTYNTNMKVSRPKISVADITAKINSGKFDDKAATKRMQQINSDIYENARKEQANNGFSFKNFIKVFGGVVLTALTFAGIHKLRRWLKMR